jgi:hypothetical protein
VNLDQMFSWIVGVVIFFAAAGKIDVLQKWIWQSQAKMIHESRSSNWGSPRFFPQQPNNKNAMTLKFRKGDNVNGK